jgi:cytochrome P450
VTWLRLLAEQEGPLDFLDRMGHRYGDVAMLETRLQNVVVVRGPEAVRHVLLGNQDNYRKSNQYELLAPVLGNGLVTSAGEVWQRQRKLVQPMFAKRHLGVFADRASEFGAALGNALHQVGAISRAASVSATQYLPHMTIMRSAMLTQNRRYRSGMRSAEVLQRIAADIVDERLRNGHGDSDDLLRLLMEAVDEETGERMDRRQVLDGAAHLHGRRA